MATKDEAKGAAKKVAGTAKEKTGKVAGDRRLQAEGKAERATGWLEKLKGKIKRKS